MEFPLLSYSFTRNRIENSTNLVGISIIGTNALYMALGLVCTTNGIAYTQKKTIEGYLNYVDHITVKKIISIQCIFVSDRISKLQFSRMQDKIYGSLVTIQYHTKCTNTLYPKLTSKNFSV